jgi:phenylpyruvate tautomerase PptA (4-oxalocrotonate tautomerase family)
VDYGNVMPVIEVAALPQAAHVDVSRVAATLSSAVASELGEDPSGTWVVWRTIEPGSYVEGRDAPTVQPDSTHPPLVRVIAYEGRSTETISRILATAADTLVAELGLAEGNAFAVWDEQQAGKVYSGGSILGA